MNQIVFNALDVPGAYLIFLAKPGQFGFRRMRWLALAALENALALRGGPCSEWFDNAWLKSEGFSNLPQRRKYGEHGTKLQRIQHFVPGS